MVKFYKPVPAHGTITADGKLIKRGKEVVLFKIYDGFGIPVRVLDRIKTVEVHYKDETYIARVELFRVYGIKHTFGDEKQLILPRKYWLVASQEKLL